MKKEKYDPMRCLKEMPGQKDLNLLDIEAFTGLLCDCKTKTQYNAFARMAARTLQYLPDEHIDVWGKADGASDKVYEYWPGPEEGEYWICGYKVTGKTWQQLGWEIKWECGRLKFIERYKIRKDEKDWLTGERSYILMGYYFDLYSKEPRILRVCAANEMIIKEYDEPTPAPKPTGQRIIGTCSLGYDLGLTDKWL